MRGTIRKRAKDSWTLWWDEPRGAGGKRRQRNKTVKGPKRVAEAELRSILSELDSGSYIPQNKLTVKDLLERWLSEYVDIQVRPNTADGYRMICDLHIMPELGILRLDELHQSHIMRYQQSALLNGRRDGKGGLSARTVKHHHRVLSEALSHAVKWGVLSRNVAQMTDPPRPSRKEVIILPPSEIDRLIDAFEGTDYYALVYTALYTGMRRGELLGLRWCDVDLPLATISVTQSLQRLYGGEFSVREPKSAHSRRLIPMPPSLAILLRSHKEHEEQQKELLGITVAPTDLVFAHLDGSPLDPSTVSHTFAQIVTESGLKNVRFHDLRHAHASLMLRTGANPKVISERLGHSSIAITMDIYSHVMPGLQEEAAIRFEEALKPRNLEEPLKVH